MKHIIIIICLLLTTINNYATDKIECLKVSGTFTESLKIWETRWSIYNNTIKSIDSATISNRFGKYILQQYTINNKKCWKQIGGYNFIWYGHKTNPHNSYDAWYVGSYPYDNTPLTQLSIPCSPTFVPNRNGLETIRNFSNTNIILISENDPTIERIYLSQEEIDKILLLCINNYSEETFGIKNISIENGELYISWNGRINTLYNVYKSTNLNEGFYLLYSNLVVYPNQKVFIEQFEGNIGFYQVIEIKGE